MDGWNEISRVAIPPNNNSIDNKDGFEFGISSISFDTVQSLIWVGDSYGFTSSYSNNQTTSPYQLELYPYTKFRSSSFNYHDPINQLMPHKNGILSLSNSQINFTTRRGIPVSEFDAQHFQDDSFRNLKSMTYNTNSFDDVVVGNNEKLFNINLNKSNLSTFDYTGGISLLNNSSKFITIANNKGSLSLFDTNSNSIIKNFNAHNGYISDLDVRGYYIATCGHSIKPRRYHQNQSPEYMIDPLVNIFDIRTMKAIAPVPFPAGATSIRFHPKLSNIIIIASATGQMQFVDIFDQTNVNLYQANLLSSQQPTNVSPKLSNLEINENGDFIVFNDSYSNIHLWSITNSGSISKSFVNFPEAIEQPDIINNNNNNNNYMDIDDTLPLSLVGMPYYKELLLSNYPADLNFVKETAKLPLEIDMELIIQTEKAAGPISINTNKWNIETEYRSLKESKDAKIPKFISEKNEESENESNKLLDESVFEYKSEAKVPKCYSRLQIQYSKFGIRDFDFSYYNKSNYYCGLENHTDNSYINSLLQLYRFQPNVYNQIVTTLNKEWLPNDIKTIEAQPEGSSILNELAYLFDMMFKAKTNNVKIYNFTQVMNHNKQAKSLINVNEMSNLNSQEVRELIISFNNFLLNQISQDFSNQFNDTFISTQLSYEIEIKGNGHSCPIYDKRLGSMFSLELITPPSNMLNKMSILMNPNFNQYQTNLSNVRKNLTILTYLEYSTNQYKTIPCQQHQHSYPHSLEIKTSITQLPSVLVLNVNLTNEEFRLIGSFKKWLLPEFYAVKTQKSGLSFKTTPTTQFNKQSREVRETKYQLLGYVCEVSHDDDNSRNGAHNLISYVKTEKGWFLFNDFLVMAIPEAEVFDLSPTWKKPIIILYQSEDQPQFQYLTDNFIGDDSILYRDHFAGPIRESYRKQYQLLTREEAPKPGSLVAIDAEFVTLKPEELEISYDGLKKLVKPKELSLARISVLRGDDGPDEGVAFIDDYIVHTSKIYDYLTSFSGIEIDDLNFTKSTKNLVTLQTAYRKLWLLLNLGAVFVGHGLYNDFRTINLQVPQSQIRDTSILYYKADFKRQLSLKFLAYIMLKEKVQKGNHDSIEDANTALLLYKRYLSLESKGQIESVLNYIYSEGQQLRYRVPE